jgi:ABC-type branched-subunit amino acid transport system ATPase component
MKTEILMLEKVSGGYGKLPIIFDVDLTVYEGETLAVIGPNGSGKSTLMKIVTGIASLHKGRIFFKGEEISSDPPYLRIMKGLGYLPQVDNVFPHLTVEENLEMGGYNLSKNILKERIKMVYGLFPEIFEKKKQKVGTLSGGERQMVAISRVLVNDPDLIILDEPSASLAPKLVSKIFEKIREIRNLGKTIILVEQHAKKALENSDRGIVMRGGKIVLTGSGEELLASKELRQAFLGA